MSSRAGLNQARGAENPVPLPVFQKLNSQNIKSDFLPDAGFRVQL